MNKSGSSELRSTGNQRFGLEFSRRSWEEESGSSAVYHLLQQMEEMGSRYRKLEETARNRKRMLGLTSHDLLSPINAISGYLDLMKLSLSENPDLQQLDHYRDQIKNGIRDISNIVHQLREMSRGNSEEEEVHAPFVLDLNWAVREVCDVMQGAALSKNQTLTGSYRHGSVFVNAEPSQLKRILYNLITNAVKYTQKGGIIRVAVRTEGMQAAVSVEDNGIGIPKENFATIFQPNNRLRLSGTEQENASGLGLYISAQFAAMMNGCITLDSEEGEGSRFTLHLPLDSEHAGFSGNNAGSSENGVSDEKQRSPASD